MSVHPADIERRHRRSDAVRTVPIVLLFVAGYVKESPLLGWVPVDLTLLAALLLGLAAAAEINRNPRTPTGWAPLVFMSALFFLPVLSSPSSPLGAEKVQTLFFLTIPAALCASIVVTSAERMWWVARWTVVSGVLMALLLRLAPTSVDLYGRLATEGANTIALGRGCGAAVVAAVALGLGRKWRWSLVAVVAIALTSVVFGSGSRGPLLAMAVAVVVMVFAQPGAKKVQYVAGLLAAVVVVGPFVVLSTNAVALSRIALLFGSDRGTSINTRELLYSLAFRLGNQNALGIGWGEFARYDTVQLYPHNVVLEIFAEAGWPAALAFCFVVLVALARIARQRDAPVMTAALGLLVFWLVNAMFSGSVNDNRAMFSLLAIGLTLPRVFCARERLVPTLVDEARRLTERRRGTHGGRHAQQRAEA